MSESFLDGRVTLHCGDCLVVLATLDENSIDACVTDPPYHLTSIVKRFAADNAAPAQFGTDGRYARASAGFMGCKWDGGDVAFQSETWAAVYRVLKPGGHIVAFGGTRTYHRMACAIEDAGFEIRDMLSWLYGSGFPKNHRVSRNPMFCQCGETVRNDDDKDREQLLDDRNDMVVDVSDDVLPLEDVRHSTDIARDFPADCLQDHDLDDERLPPFADGDQVLLPLQQHAPIHTRSFEPDDVMDYGLERILSPAQYNDHLSNQDCSSRASSESAQQDYIDTNTLRADISEFVTHKQGNGQGLSSNKYASGFPRCQECGKSIADGFGTSLKPACEPICFARKPLSEGTVAANVLRWGCGAINVDGCRVPSPDGVARVQHHKTDAESIFKGINGGTLIEPSFNGRWPSNLILDGSTEVLAGFPVTESTPPGNIKPSPSTANAYGEYQKRSLVGHTDSGSAARFFYTAKADSDDRLGSKHPTVKPVDLMQWLCRLVTPPGGTILDCFAGTGTTGEAAFHEGFKAVLIEREAEYQADIRRRMALVMAGPDERVRESIKAKDLPIDHGPLFGWVP